MQMLLYETFGGFSKSPAPKSRFIQFKLLNLSYKNQHSHLFNAYSSYKSTISNLLMTYSSYKSLKFSIQITPFQYKSNLYFLNSPTAHFLLLHLLIDIKQSSSEYGLLRLHKLCNSVTSAPE